MRLVANIFLADAFARVGRFIRGRVAAGRGILQRRRKLDTLDHLHEELVSRVAVTIAVLGVLLGTNQLLEVRITGQRDAADRSYHQLLTNLGSPRLAVRVGAIGQIPVVLRLSVPTEAPPPWWAGVLYWAVPHRYPMEHAYHESVLSVLQAIAREPKHGSESAGAETQALIEALCDIGPEGWYMAELSKPTVRELCLAWIWKDAPTAAITSQPAVHLFRGACIDGGDFDRLELTRADFGQAHLRATYFRDSDLTSANFDRSRLENVDFSRATLRNASFKGAELTDAIFDGADVEGVNFTDSGITAEHLVRALNVSSATGLAIARSKAE